MALIRKFLTIFVRVWFTAKMAMQGILSNPLRSALTILGVTIGVTSVVSLMGIGEGARLAVIEQFESLGTNVIQIQSHHASVVFEPEYADELVERVDGLLVATPIVNTKATMKWRRAIGSVEILGASSDFPTVRDHKLIAGHFFTSLHVKQRSPVAVLGYNIATGLLNGRNVVGYTLTLNGQTFRIIGVLAQKGNGVADNIDNKIVIPYSTALKLDDKRTVSEIWGKAPTSLDADLAVVQLSRIIKKKLGIGAGSSGSPSVPTDPGIIEKEMLLKAAAGGYVVYDSVMPYPGSGSSSGSSNLSFIGEDIVTITNLNQLVEEADSANRVMTLLLGGIAAVSLLVGGLGIMNIMMVAVNERIEEIGLRRAVGAKQGDLLLQFLLEALYVSIIGTIAGIVAGVWGLGIFENLGYETAVSMHAIKIASAVALSSGLLFGVYPAISASSVPPIEALRRQ
ncbi:MAG TPA: FtsX-like permease family protein [Clostridiaceae bacterium]|nr:FtsX-like permease family protein [Clostridiaceae bacterium]